MQTQVAPPEVDLRTCHLDHFTVRPHHLDITLRDLGKKKRVFGWEGSQISSTFSQILQAHLNEPSIDPGATLTPRLPIDQANICTQMTISDEREGSANPDGQTERDKVARSPGNQVADLISLTN